MSFRRWITTLAVLALFAGLASAQVADGAAVAGLFGCQVSVAVPPAIRAEGLTELIGDIVLTCTGGTTPTVGTQIPTADITVTLGTNVTSRLLANYSGLSPLTANNTSEALLLIDEPGSGLTMGGTPVPGWGPGAPQTLCGGSGAPFSLFGAVTGGCVEYAQQLSNGDHVMSSSPSSPVAGANVFAGVANANQVTFYGIPIMPPQYAGVARIFRMTNIRINASLLGVTGPTPVLATVAASGGASLPLSGQIPTVGSAEPGLTFSIRTPDDSTVLTTPNFSGCSANVACPYGMVRFSENFGTAFETRVVPLSATAGSGQARNLTGQNIPGTIYNSASGFIFSGITGTINNAVAGLADFGTRLTAQFDGIPTGVSIWVATTNIANLVTAPAGNSTTSFAQLVTSATAVDNDGSTPSVASAGSLTWNGTPASYGYAPLSVVSGSATAVWEIVNANPATAENFDFPVWIVFNPGVTPAAMSIGGNARFAATATAPTVTSVSPASGSGPSQTFAVTLTDPQGAAAISTVYVLINSTFSASSGCFLALYPGSPNSLSLVNDAANGWQGPSTVGSGTALSNSQCTVNAAAASVVPSGNQLTLNLPLAFASGFLGTKNVYVDAIDNLSQDTGWQTMGTWTVARPPTVVSVSPASGTGSPQTFAVTLSDPQGAAAISTVYVLINSTLSASSGCFLALYPGSASSLSLVNDAATGWQGPSTVGSGTALSNSQCTVNATGASVVPSGNQLTLNLPLSFQAGFAGTKNVYVDVIDNAGQNSGWQTMGTWTVGAAPTVVSVSPASGSGPSQTFAVTLSDARGAAAISTVYVLINSTLSAPSGCFVALYPGSTNSLSLVNDAAAAWLGPSTVGSGTALSNSQCTVGAAAASVVSSGNQLTLNLPLTFASGFAGAKNVYVDVLDNAGQSSGWQTMGTWTAAGTPPTVVSVSPASGSGLSQTFAVTLSDPRGAAAITTVYVLINSTLSAASGCYVALYPGSASSLSLANDAANGWVGPSTVGSGTALSNSQCTVNAAGTSVVLSGNQLTLNLPLTFTSGFAGTQNVYVDVSDASQTSGWQTMATWTVSGAPPTVVSVSPSSGSGSSQTFAVTLSDPRGAATISTVYVLINSTLSAASGCFLALYPGSPSSLSLVNNAGNGWQGPSTVGSGASMSNSQCTVNAAGTSLALSGNQLTLNLPLTFTSGFAGTKNVYVDFTDTAGQNTGWQTMGTWTVGAAPTVVSVSPASGSGLSQTFTVTYSDPRGAATITTAYLLINSTFSAASGCFVALSGGSTNTLSLVTDAGNGWLGPSTVGSGTALSNSQCTVSAAGTSVVLSGSQLTLNLPLTFTSGFAGAKNVYADVTDSAGQNSGWQTVGTWTVH